MVEDVVIRFYNCLISDSKQGPVKPSEIPETEWHTLSADFGDRIQVVTTTQK